MITQADSTVPSSATEFLFHPSFGSCRVTGGLVWMLQRPVGHFPRACAQPHNRLSLPITAKEVLGHPPNPVPVSLSPCSRFASRSIGIHSISTARREQPRYTFFYVNG
jgi:hypothetical protein